MTALPSGRAALFGFTTFLSAALLFLVEPMIARALLPRFGGSPAVWTTAMLVFQAGLLAGYLYAHVLSFQPFLVHSLVLLAVLYFGANLDPARLPFSPTTQPTLSLSVAIVRSVGLPFFLLATTAPLLQRWYSRAPGGRDPYFLYAASNAGSLLALLAYPLWIERSYRLTEQARAWTTGLYVVLACQFACAFASLATTSSQVREIETRDDQNVQASTFFGWVLLAFIPSSLMLGVTTYLTTDLASIPLLWAIPLALYLGAFVVAFSRMRDGALRAAARGLPFLVTAQAVTMGAGVVWPILIVLHLATFLASALLCHGELALRRPEPASLTTFYLAISIGGALGGVFNALIAPVLFTRPAEYPIALVAACLVLAFRSGHPEKLGGRMLVLPAILGGIVGLLCLDPGGLSGSAAGALLTVLAAGLTLLVAVQHRRRPARFALTIGALLAASSLATAVNGRVLHRERNFFGVLTVTAVDAPPAHRLFHGGTLHGQQSWRPAHRRDPLTYFTRSGPIGDLFRAFDARAEARKSRVGVTGVGAGSLASYAQPGQRWRFFEIDPAVVRIASDPRDFTYLSDCRADAIDTIVGDARLSLIREADASFDLLILDAFSSDSIPTHLLTREALALYRRKLRPTGLLIANITNRYLNLSPVIASLARDAGLVARVRIDAKVSVEEKIQGKQGSIWAVLAESERVLGPIASDPNWRAPAEKPGDRVWSDDFHAVLDHLWIVSP